MSIMTQMKVLELNRTWQPVGVVTLERAIILATSTYDDGEPKAQIIAKSMDSFRTYDWEQWSELIASENEPVIRSARASFRIPEIITLRRYNDLPQQRLHFSRRTIYRRDGNQCQYCHRRPGTEELSIDHIVPRSKGGLTTWTNCCLACVECNRYKADILPKKKVLIEKVGIKTKAVTYYTVTFNNGKKTWEATIREPKKPRYSFYKGEVKCQSWIDLLGEAYWLTELENDIED